MVLIKMRKGVIFTIKGCFRSVCNHPFLVCLLCVLIYMYRSYPCMFSLLVSASPILVCTAVLLGTLLFFGQRNVEKSRVFVPQETELSKEGNNVEKNERRGESEETNVGSSLSESRRGEICSEGSVDDGATLDKNVEVSETKRELDERRGESKSEWNDGGVSDGEVMDNRKANDQDSEYDKSEAESFDSEMVNVDSLASSGRLSWKQVEQDDDDDALDSGSDQAESSSPDASMADMMPMLDELHPLLDEDAPQPIQMSCIGSVAPSELSQRSSSSSNISVDETDNPEDSVAEGEDDDDDDEDAQQDKGFRANSAIAWTEEDQKNLMKVGSSEIERNQRLENVILRRKTRKHVSMVPEFNLIDLESSDFPMNIPSISTSRQNPFDVPDDAYVMSGLPPIPGSAPSILLPRRNPFDMPYDDDPSEEKQNIMGDGSQKEHKAFQSRDPFIRRREGFNIGPSAFAPNRQDHLKLRPYFVPERMDLEEPSYSTLQRQSSEMSDSKVSSVPDTESISSVEKLEEDAPYEQEAIPEIKHVTEDVGHGSQSSDGEEECVELGSVENRESEVDNLKFQSESEAVEQRHSRGSSISSLSEVSQRVFTKIDDDIPHKEPIYDSSPPKRANDEISSDQRFDENWTDEQSRESPVPIGEGQPEVEHSVNDKETAMSPTSDADFEEACEKILTPTAGGSTSHFYVRAMHEKDFEHLEEVQVPNTPVEPSEKVRGIQNIHIPGLQEQLDRDVSPNAKRSFIPQSIPEPEEAVSHVDIQTKNADADEVKDIHEGLLSELASVGTQTKSSPRELEKQIDAERVSSPHLSETSEIRAVEVSPAEENKMEQDISAVEVNPVETNKIEHDISAEDNPVELSKIDHDISVVEVDPIEVNKIEHEMDLVNSRDETEDIGADHKREMMLTGEELEPNTDARSGEVKGERAESPVGEESSVREDDPHSTSDTETDKNSKSSSSPTSFWAKRRLSTPFF